MRTTVIPAQITTVEDKIAGNLNFTQIILLMTPVIWGTLVYTVFPKPMSIALYKLPVFLVVAAACGILSLRVKGKVIANWLGVVLRFNLRPKYYLFNKNDSFLRDMYLPEFEKKEKVLKKAGKKKEIKIPAKSFGMKELMDLKGFLQNPEYSLSLKPDKKGGLYVALEQNQK